MNIRQLCFFLICLALGSISLIGQTALADDLGQTPEIQFSSSDAKSLSDKAQEFGNAAAIYEFVRNEFAYSLYHGARSDSINTFGARRGNDIDQASVLIAMLRSRNIPARYGVGNVRMTASQLKAWLGVENIDLAAFLLTNAGIENVVLASDKQTVDFQHVWVEALVDYSFYRGVPEGQPPLDCAAHRSQCQWIALDPSFKQNTPSDSSIDVYETVLFDYNAYYQAIATNDRGRIGKNPLEIYEDQIRAALPSGTTLADVAYLGPIQRDHSGILPASLSYQVIGNVRHYDSVDDHDLPASSEPWPWAKFLQVQVDTAGHTYTSPRLRLTEFSTQRLSFHLRGGTPLRQGLVLGTTERLAVNLDGSVTDTQTGAPVGIDSTYTLTLKMDGAPAATTGVTRTVNAVYNSLRFGGYVVIGTGGETSNQAQVQRAKDKLLQAAKDYPVVFNPAEPTIPYLDVNVSGAYEAGTDVKLILSETPMNALTGGLLETAVYSFYAQLNEKRSRLDALQHTTTPINGFVGIASSVFDVQYDNGSPFAIVPGGLVIDMLGLEVLGSWRVNNGPDVTSDRTFELFGHIVSSSEHEVWQQLTGYDAVSTVRGIQIAAANGVNIVEAVHNSTRDTGTAPFLSLGFQTTVPSPWVARQTSVFNKTLVTWYVTDGQDHAFSLLRANLQPADPSYMGNALYYLSNNGIDYFVNQVNALEENLKTGIAQYGANCIVTSPGYTFGGSQHSGPCTTVLSELETYFRSETEPAGNDPDSVANREFYSIIDITKGFNPAQALYRIFPQASDQHDSSIASEINTALYHNDVTKKWPRYIIPARMTMGPNYAFSVYIHHTYNIHDQLGESLYLIANNSGSYGGGYVDSTNLLEQYVPSDSPKPLTPEYVNQIFTNQNNVSVANNDTVRTPSTSDPVSTVTGNMYHDETDFIIKNRGVDYVLTRTYNSNVAQSATTPGPLGYGWTHSYNLSLVSKDTGICPNCEDDPSNINGVTSSVVFVDERGGDHVYLIEEGTQAITNPPGEFDTLVLNTAPGQHQIRYRNGNVYTFENGTNLATTPGVTARLKSIADPYGNTLNLTYNANGQLTNVRDNLNISGRTGLTFTYYTGGRLASVQDWTGRTVSFGYYSDNTLGIVQDPRTYQWTYNYKSGTKLLRTVAKPILRDGQAVYTKFEYYSNEKAYDYVNNLGHREALAYDLHRARTTVTGPRGFDTEHTYDPANGQLLKLVEADGAVKTFANTGDGLRYQKTDGLGRSTQYSYRADRSFGTGASDTQGLVTRERDPAGRDIDYSYGLYDQITQVVDKRGNTVRRTYYPTTNQSSRAAIGKLNEVFARIDGQEVLMEKYYWDANSNLREKREYVQPGSTAAYRVTYYNYDANELYLVRIAEGETSNGATFDRGYRERYFEADGLGRMKLETVIRVQSPEQMTTGIETGTYRVYDKQDRVIEERQGRYYYDTGTFTSEKYSEWIYDGNGQLAQERTTYTLPAPDATHTYARHAYDAADRRISTTDILGNVTRFEYDQAGNLTAQTDANGHTTRSEYDAMNRRTAMINANGHRSTMSYDQAGRLIETTDANSNTTRFEYDALGRRTALVTPEGRRTEYAYDANGNLTGIKDANATAGSQPLNSYGFTEYREYDELNRLRKVVAADNSQSQYGHDLLGRTSQITDARGQVTSMEYDYQGNVVRVIDPLHESPTDKVATYLFDQAGNLIKAMDRDGRERRFFFDQYNRLTRIDYIQGGVAEEKDFFDYDQYGNLASNSTGRRRQDGNYDTTSQSTMTYTTRHAIDTLTELNGHSLRFGYDGVGNVVTKTDYQGHTTTFQYDSTNRLVAERNPHFLQVSYHYDGAGRLLNRILSNGAQTDYRFDADNRLTGLKNLSAKAAVVEDLSYQRDSIGNITRIADVSGKTVQYTYDPLYRLRTVDSTDNTEDRSYTYDSVGNRLTATENGTTTYYCYHATNCSQAPAGNRLYNLRTGSATGPISRQFTYTDSGQVREKRTGSNALLYGLTYNARGWASGIETPAASIASLYDTAGYRVSRSENGVFTTYLRQGEHVEAIYDDADNLSWEYFRGVVVDEIVNGYRYPTANANDKINYSFHHDHLNSVTALSGHEGTIKETWEYDAFGKPLTVTLPGTGNSLLYTGREYDKATGLYYYRARYYDPEIGRFISEDPLGFKAGVNFYAYVSNNPVNRKDPSGLFDVFGFVEGDLVGILGFEGGLGIVIDTDNLGESGIFRTRGGAGGANVGLSGGLGFAIRELEGISINYDMNLKLVSPTFSFDDKGFNGAALGVGPGVGASSSVTSTSTYSVNDLISDVKGWFGSAEGNSSASGGFVLYPNKPNTNMIKTVYSK